MDMPDYIMWGAYIKGYLMTAITDDSITVADMTNKIIEIIDSTGIADIEIYGLLSSAIDFGNATKQLDFINAFIVQKPRFKQGLFPLRIVLLHKISGTSIEVLKTEITNYEQEFGRDRSSIALLLHSYLMDGYEKHIDQIRSLTAEIEPLMEGK